MLKHSLNIFLFYFFAASCVFQIKADTMLEKGRQAANPKHETSRALWATGWAFATIVATAGTLYSHQWLYQSVKAHPHKNDNNPSSTHQRTQALTGPARAANLQSTAAMQHASQLPAPPLIAHTPMLTPIALTPAVAAVAAQPIPLQSPLSNSHADPSPYSSPDALPPHAVDQAAQQADEDSRLKARQQALEKIRAVTYIMNLADDDIPDKSNLSLDDGIRYGFPSNPYLFDGQQVAIRDRTLKQWDAYTWNASEKHWVYTGRPNFNTR